MTDIKVTGRPIASSALSTDIVPIVRPTDTTDDPTGSDYQVTLGNIRNLIQVPQTYTFATLPSASGNSGLEVWCSDLKCNFYSDGTKWIAASPSTLINQATGWIVPSLAASNAATYTQTGTTISVNNGTAHNIPNTENGSSIYLVIGSGLATSGWFTNFTYVDANNFTCTSTVSQSTSGTVNSNTAETTITPLSVTVPGGLLGVNGKVLTDFLSTHSNTAANKNYKIKVSGNNILSTIASTNTAFRMLNEFFNRNATNSQISSATMPLNSVTASNGLAYTSIDTTISQLYSITLQCTSANDYCCISSVLVQVLQ